MVLKPHHNQPNFLKSKLSSLQVNFYILSSHNHHLILTQVDSDRNGLTTQKLARTLLKQKGYNATIWILCLKKTQDKVWVDAALENFDESKIEYLEFKTLLL